MPPRQTAISRLIELQRNDSSGNQNYRGGQSNTRGRASTSALSGSGHSALSVRGSGVRKASKESSMAMCIVEYIVERIRTAQLQHLYIWVAERDILDGGVEQATDTYLPDFLNSKSTNRGVVSPIIQRRTNAAVEQEPANATVGGAPALEEAR